MLHVAAHIKAMSGTSLKTNVRENACKQSLLISQLFLLISTQFGLLDTAQRLRIDIRGPNDQLTPEDGRYSVAETHCSVLIFETLDDEHGLILNTAGRFNST